MQRHDRWNYFNYFTEIESIRKKAARTCWCRARLAIMEPGTSRCRWKRAERDDRRLKVMDVRDAERENR